MWDMGVGGETPIPTNPSWTFLTFQFELRKGDIPEEMPTTERVYCLLLRTSMNLILRRPRFMGQASQCSELSNRVKIKVRIPWPTQEVMVLWSMGLLGTCLVWVIGSCGDPYWCLGPSSGCWWNCSWAFRDVWRRFFLGGINRWVKSS